MCGAGTAGQQLLWQDPVLELRGLREHPGQTRGSPSLSRPCLCCKYFLDNFQQVVIVLNLTMLCGNIGCGGGTHAASLPTVLLLYVQPLQSVVCLAIYI